MSLQYFEGKFLVCISPKLAPCRAKVTKPRLEMLKLLGKFWYEVLLRLQNKWCQNVVIFSQGLLKLSCDFNKLMETTLTIDNTSGLSEENCQTSELETM